VPAIPVLDSERQVQFMKTLRWLSLTLTAGLAFSAGAQGVLFDFDSAPIHSPLPITLTVGGITATFSGTGQGFSIQAASTLGFTPAGFAGNCIYPSSVYAADLLISFDQRVTGFSILYAPEEYACDSSARMRVTADLDGVSVGTATMTADPPGTWPSATLSISTNQAFNRVVVHYDAAPPTGGDYGPIFMADNMVVTPAPPDLVLSNPTITAEGAFQFTFVNTPGSVFSVYGSDNPSLPFSAWTLLGSATEVTPGQFQFSDPQATKRLGYFYRVAGP
jgi:hypothetical protein